LTISAGVVVNWEDAVKYLCLVYIDPVKAAALSRRDSNELTREALAYDNELSRAGHYIVSNALDEPSAAATVRVGAGGISVTDGPFAETKEHLGGFILIEAHDLNEAIRIAGKIPPARIGCIEVRPTVELSVD
jgi:hypothetical protein